MITLLSQRSQSRGLIIGSPNTGKTSLLESIAAWYTENDPDTEIAVLAMPGEKGVKSIPEGENLRVYVGSYPELSEVAEPLEYYQRSMEMYQDTLHATREILKGKYGLLFLDGLSKFYEVCLDIVTKGKYLRGTVFQETGDYTTRLYGHSHTLFRNYLTEIYASTGIPCIIATSWEKLGQDDENSSTRDQKEALRQGTRVWLPALPGQMGNNAAGEFDWCIRAGFTHSNQCTMCLAYAKKGLKDQVQQGEHYTFQLKPSGDVQCVNIKGPRGRYIPTYIHQEWEYLREYI